MQTRDLEARECLEIPETGQKPLHESCTNPRPATLGFKPKMPFAPQRGHGAKQNSPSVMRMSHFEGFDGWEATFPCRYQIAWRIRRTET